MNVPGVAITVTPPASASEHSPPRSACPARCNATSDDEHAVSSVTAGPSSPITNDTRPDTTLVVVPVSRNAVVTVSLFAFLWAWSDFLFANTLDGGGGHQPITLGIYAYIGNNNQQWNAIMATAVVASIPAAVLLVLAQRYVAAGVTSGAVKD